MMSMRIGWRGCLRRFDEFGLFDGFDLWGAVGRFGRFCSKHEKTMTIEKLEDLIIWQLGRELAKEIYELTKSDCFKEDYEFRSQIRNSSGSVPDNIAEGFEREGNNEFIQFLSISKGSCGECRSQIYRAFDRAYIDKAKLDYFVEKTSRLCSKIHNTIAAVRKSDFRGRKYKTEQSENAPQTNQTPQTIQTIQTKL